MHLSNAAKQTEPATYGVGNITRASGDHTALTPVIENPRETVAQKCGRQKIRLSMLRGKSSLTGPTTNPISKVFACAVVAFVAIYAGLWLSFGPPVDPARIVGITSGLVVTPAIIVGIWARNSKKTWPLFRVIALYALFLVIIAALYISGSMSNPRH